MKNLIFVVAASLALVACGNEDPSPVDPGVVTEDPGAGERPEVDERVPTLTTPLPLASVPEEESQSK